MRLQTIVVPILVAPVLALFGCSSAATSTTDGSGAGMNLHITSASLSSSPALPAAGGTVTVSIVVANNGTVATPATTFSFTFDGTTSSSNVLPAIAGGATATVLCAVTSATAGTLPVVVALDPANTVNERSESDNSATINVTWSGLSRRNISLSGVSPADATLTIGGTATLNFTLGISGTDVLTGPLVLQTLQWRIVREDDLTVVKTSSSSFVNSSVTLSTTFDDATAVGPQSYIMQVDYAGAVAESDETDNAASFTITWDPPSGSG